MPMANRAAVRARQVAVEQVADPAGWSRSRTPRAGILLLVVNDVPGSVRPPRPRAFLNSSTPSASGIMMKPRSALVTSSAESMTSVSTSSSTRPGSEGAEAVEDRRHLGEIARVGGGGAQHRTTASSSARNTSSHVVAVAEADRVAVHQAAARQSARRSTKVP
jgi:hypothetical protein